MTAPTLNTTVKLGGLPCVHWRPEYGEPRKANSYWCPVGPEPGIAWLLMTREKFDEVRVAGEPATLEMQSVTVDTIAGKEKTNTETLTCPLYLIEGNRLFRGGPADPNALFLLHLADKRILGRFSSGTGTYNLRSYAQDTDFLTGTAGFTWDSMLEDLWDQLPDTFGAWPGFPGGYTPSGTPEGWNITGGNLWRNIHAILHKMRVTTAYDPVADAFRLIELGATQVHTGDLPTADWDAETIEGIAANIPNVIGQFFPDHAKSYGQEADTGLASNWLQKPAWTRVSAGTVPGTAAGTKLDVYDDLPGVLSEDNALTNAAALIARNAELKTQILQDLQSPHAHKIVKGIVVKQLPGSENKAMLWRHWGKSGGGSATEVWQHPGIPAAPPEASGRKGGIFLPAAENIAPFDITRNTFPNYPRLPNIVQVFHSEGSQGDLVAANGDELHLGRVRRWVSGSMATLETCWIRFVDDHDNLAGAVPVIDGDFFLGRLSGIETSGGDTWPIYLARRGVMDNGPFAFEAFNSADLEIETNADPSVIAYTTIPINTLDSSPQTAVDVPTAAPVDAFTLKTAANGEDIGTLLFNVNGLAQIDFGVYVEAGTTGDPTGNQVAVEVHTDLQYKPSGGSWTADGSPFPASRLDIGFWHQTVANHQDHESGSWSRKLWVSVGDQIRLRAALGGANEAATLPAELCFLGVHLINHPQVTW